MIIRGSKKYICKDKTKYENQLFINSLEAAEYKLSKALDIITYNSLPSVNKGTIGSLKDIIGNISRLKYNVENGHTKLLQPVEVKNVFIYELSYFRGRKDNGIFHVKSELDIDDFVDEDTFLNSLTAELLPVEINSIVNVKKISEEGVDDGALWTMCEILDLLNGGN